MGHIQSNSVQSARQLNYDELRSNSNFDGEIVEDFRYGSGLLILNHQLAIKMLLQTQTYTLLAQYNQTCDDAQSRLLINVPTVVQLIKYNGSEYSNQQGKSFKISMLYEFHQRTLQDEIIERANSERKNPTIS
jgi:hypothetical protein